MAQMLLDDLVDVVLVDIGVPGFFRVHDDAGALLAAVQTTRLVDAHSAFAGEIELFHTLLGVVPGLRLPVQQRVHVAGQQARVVDAATEARVADVPVGPVRQIAQVAARRRLDPRRPRTRY